MAASARGGRGGAKLTSGNASSWRSSQPNTPNREDAGRGPPGGGIGGPKPTAATGQAHGGSRWASGPPRSVHAACHEGRTVPGSAAYSARSSAGNHAKAGTAPSGGSSGFPSLAAGAATGVAAKMRDRMSFLLTSLIGTTVTASTRSGKTYVGILSSTPTDTGELGVVLSFAQEILSPAAERAVDASQAPRLGSPEQTLSIPGRELEEVNVAEVRLGETQSGSREKSGFRTDTQISMTDFDAAFEGRTLQKWSDDDPALEGLGDGAGLRIGPDASGNQRFGQGGSGIGWDQFAANEAKFGIKSNYEETLYTTKLDRSGEDFKERERKADQLAREILSATSDNPHLVEERNQAHAGGGEATEEDKYGAVIRGAGAYVPPGARKAAAAAAAGAGNVVGAGAVASQANGNSGPSAEEAKASPASGAPNPPPPSVPALHTQAATPTLGSTPEGGAAATAGAGEKRKSEMDGVTADFRDFVAKERERLEKKKQALAKKEKDTRLAELKSWANSFQLKTPMPTDVATLIHRDGSDAKRDVAASKGLSPTAAQIAGHGTSTPQSQTLGTQSQVHSPSGGAGSARISDRVSGGSTAKLTDPKVMLANMTIPKIPPFNPDKVRARQAQQQQQQQHAGVPQPGMSSSTSTTNALSAPKPDASASPQAGNTSSFKLSAKASAFKPFNPAAASFTPGASLRKPDAPSSAALAPSAAAAAAASSVMASLSAAPANPFFGNKVIRKHSYPLHVREEFNPLKAGKVPEASTVGPLWPFTGKPFRQLFAVIPPAAPYTPTMLPPVPGSVPPFEGGEPGQMPLPPVAYATPVPTPVMPHSGPGAPPAPVVSQAQLPPTPQQHHAAGAMRPPPGHGGAPAAGAAGQPGPGQQQPYGMMYPPYPPYRFPGQQMMGHMHMPQGAGAMPYGGMPPQYVGHQMPFSPPMPGHAVAPPGVYSPQMANMPATPANFGGGQHLVPNPGPANAGGLPGGPGGGAANGPPNGPGGAAAAGGPQARPGAGPMPPPPPLPHMQGKMPPPQMFYGQPGPGIPYGYQPGGAGGGPMAGQPPFRGGGAPPPPPAPEPGNQH